MIARCVGRGSWTAAQTVPPRTVPPVRVPGLQRHAALEEEVNGLEPPSIGGPMEPIQSCSGASEKVRAAVEEVCHPGRTAVEAGAGHCFVQRGRIGREPALRDPRRHQRRGTWWFGEERIQPREVAAVQTSRDSRKITQL